MLIFKRAYHNLRVLPQLAVTSRASKLQVFKVWKLWDLNPGLPRESLNIGKLTHVGGPGSNPGQAEISDV